MGVLEGVNVPDLSLNHMIQVFRSLPEKTISAFLTHFQNNGIVATEDFETRKPKEVNSINRTFLSLGNFIKTIFYI